MYAIVDIETTGGHASANGITEVAIVIHDGREITGRFQTLINPGMSIPLYIQALTGISNELVRQAPTFAEVAPRIFELLDGKVFVAHNVNFDYSFLNHHLAAAGFTLNCRKLCTVRLGRKLFPGLPSYSLGKFSKQMGVVITDRHRAGGDAEATAILFSMMLEKDVENHIAQLLNPRSKEQSLPSHLPREQVERLPYTPGVYYFHNRVGKVIYVGKAKNLQKRVRSHFTNNSPGKQKQDFLREIHSITYQDCGNELMAFVLEAIEIKRLWPANNRSQKRFEQRWGLYVYEDQGGYLRLAIDKKRKYAQPVYSLNTLLDGYSLVRSLMNEFKLCPKLCFVQRNQEVCSGVAAGTCTGACESAEPPLLYNERVQNALHHLRSALPTFAYLDQGRSLDEKSCILIEEGRFYGMGFVTGSTEMTELAVLKTKLTPYPENEYIRNLVHQYATRFPLRKLSF